MEKALLLYVLFLHSWKTPVKLIGSGLYSAPLTLFNRTKHTMIISPFKEFMASSLVFDNANDIIMEGIMGNVTEIPKDFIQQTILYYGQGPGIKTVSSLLSLLLSSIRCEETEFRFVPFK